MKMPTSNIDSYLQDARENFDAVRPAPIYSDDHQRIVRCQNVHVSTNCYYGYQDLKSTGDNHVDTDCEMAEVGAEAVQQLQHKTSTKSLSKKRCADEQDYPQTKRLRDEVQKEKQIEPETNETMTLDANSEDLLELLYWNVHGGNIYHLIQCL